MGKTESKITQKKERSRAYPVMALDEALKKLANINQNLGASGKFNRESIAVGMGYSSLSGASARAIAAMVQFGLLRREKDLYTLSDLARSYLLPVGDNDEASAVHKAALMPPLFAEVFITFKGQVIPRQFVNRLIQEFGIQQKVAPEVERIFKSTMTTAGILQPNGVLRDADMPSQGRTQDATTEGEGFDESQEQPSPTAAVVPTGMLSVELPSGITVSYPQSLAPAFAFGKFGAQLMALDNAISAHGALDDSQHKDIEV